jgi:hypothetical protein
MDRAYLHARLEREVEETYDVFPLISLNANGGASSLAHASENDESAGNDCDNPWVTHGLLLTRFFKRLTDKYREVEKCFLGDAAYLKTGESREVTRSGEKVPFQFFMPSRPSVREHGVYVECAIEKKKVPAVKICADATSFEKSELRLKFLDEDEGDESRAMARNEARVLRVLPDAVLNYLTKEESKFESFGWCEQTCAKRFILRRNKETPTTTTGKDFINFTVEGVEVERPFVRYRGCRSATARSISERNTASESVSNASLEITSVRPFSMALKRIGDLKIACQRANVPIESMVPFFTPKAGKKRKAAELENGGFEEEEISVLDISSTPLSVVAIPRVEKQAIVICLRRELPLSLGFSSDEDYCESFAAFHHLSIDKGSLIDRGFASDIQAKKEYYGVKYADVVFENTSERWVYPITLLLKRNGATEIVARNTEEYSQSLIVKNFAESIENTTHLGISVSFSRDEENGGAIEREAMANGNNMIANEGDILDATAGQISIDPLLQALQTHSPPFLGFRLALDEYNDPILESTPNTRRQLRRASSISAGANFSDVMHDLRGLPTQNTIPVTLDLNQPLAIDEHEKMNVVLAQQQHFLLNSPVQNEDAVMAFTTSDERKAKKAKATPAKATKTMKIPPVPKIRVPHSSLSASAKSTKKPAPPKKTKSKDKDSERLDTISAILQDAKTKDSKKGPNYLTIDDLLYFLESIDPTLGADYRKRSAKRQSGQPKRADLLKVAVQLNMKTARTSFQRNNRVA